MKKLLIIVALLAICATSAFAAYEGPFTQTWDFTNDTAGWAVNANGTAAGWTSAFGGTLYLPDTSYATMTAAGMNLGGFNGASRFVIQTQVFIGANNFLQGSGIAVCRTADNKGPSIAGSSASTQGVSFNDKSWFNSTKTMSWGLAEGQWTTLQIDYGYTTAGKFTASYLACPGNAGGKSGWVEVWSEAMNGTGTKYADTNPSQIFDFFRLGDNPSEVGGTGWTQAYYKNVQLVTVPEPGSFVALGAGMVGMVGFAIRRRK